MEISWKGWTDDAIMSPFMRQHVDHDATPEIAPDDVSEHSYIFIEYIKAAPSLLGSATVDAPHASYLRSSLNPAALAFQPIKKQVPNS